MVNFNRIELYWISRKIRVKEGERRLLRTTQKQNYEYDTDVVRKEDKTRLESRRDFPELEFDSSLNLEKPKTRKIQIGLLQDIYSEIKTKGNDNNLSKRSFDINKAYGIISIPKKRWGRKYNIDGFVIFRIKDDENLHDYYLFPYIGSSVYTQGFLGGCDSSNGYKLDFVDNPIPIGNLETMINRIINFSF